MECKMMTLYRYQIVYTPSHNRLRKKLQYDMYSVSTIPDRDYNDYHPTTIKKLHNTNDLHYH